MKKKPDGYIWRIIVPDLSPYYFKEIAVLSFEETAEIAENYQNVHGQIKIRLFRTPFKIITSSSSPTQYFGKTKYMGHWHRSRGWVDKKNIKLRILTNGCP